MIRSTIFSLTTALFFMTASFSVAADSPMGADRHVSRGVSCVQCHGQDMNNPQMPTKKTCTACHKKDDLIAKTKAIKPTNPHAAPHNGDCFLCHTQHEKPRDYCAACHHFNYQPR